MTQIQKVFVAGSVVFLVAVGIFGGVIAGHWDTLTGAYRSTGTNLRFQSAVQARFGTGETSAMLTTRDGENTLLIQVSNPSFLDGATREQLQAKAKEIAALARDTWPPGETIDRYDIRISKRSGFMFRTSRFTVEARDLPPATTPAPFASASDERR